MKPGKIVIKENKVYFVPDGIEKPVNPGRDGSFTEDINYIKKVEEYIASKQSIEVSNVNKRSGKWYYDNIGIKCSNTDWTVMKKEVISNRSCKAEVTNNKVTIIELN